MDDSQLTDILLLLSAAVAMVVLALRCQLPSILGYLALGALMGPHGLGLVDNSPQFQYFAEFGVVFLLFMIGLEFSAPLLLRMRGAVFGLGGAQVLVTGSIAAAGALLLGLSLAGAVVLGGVVAMSSTALVTRQLAHQGELHARHGRNAMGILLFQDLMVIPLLMLLNGLSGPATDASALAVGTVLLRSLLVLVAILAIGRWVLRPLFRAVAGFRSTELFTLTALLVALGAAGLTHQFGMSLALGAFVAGVMLSETEFRHQLEAEIRPFRDVLLGLFFASMGMLVNPRLLPEIWPWVLLLLAALLVFKFAVVAVLCRLAGATSAVALRTGLVLAQGGEFGFALLALAQQGEVLPADYAQVVLTALLISMAVAPLLIRTNARLVARWLPQAAARGAQATAEDIAAMAKDRTRHVIICGYGRVGQNIGHLLQREQIPFIALDMDATLVANAVAQHLPVAWGDAANPDLLKAAGLARAAALLISLDDPDTARRVLLHARQFNPDLPILVRARDTTQLAQLRATGASDVIPETMETSLALAASLLLAVGVAEDRVQDRLGEARADYYRPLHPLIRGRAAAAERT